MSHTMVVAPIMGALIKSEDILGKNRQWHAMNSAQKEFLKKFFAKRKELAKFSEKELRSWVSWVAAELNAILAKEGFNIKLNDFAPDEFGVVSILDVLVEWLQEGSKTVLNIDNTSYPAVKMDLRAMVDGKQETLFEVYTTSMHKNPVAMLFTKSGDKLYITTAGISPIKDFALVSLIDEIRHSLGPSRIRYDWLEFPMVNLDQEVNIGWLKGMQTSDDNGQEWAISQAVQQTKFKMNQFGARVKSAVAISIVAVSIRREVGLIITPPFLLWIEKKDASIPVLYAYIDKEHCKDPGDLSSM